MQVDIKKFQDALEEEFKDNKELQYEDKFEDNSFHKDQVKDQDEYLRVVDIDYIDIDDLVELSMFHFEYAIYKNEKDLKEEAKEYLSKASQYGFNALHYGAQSCGCFEEKDPFIMQHKAVFMMSNLLLTSNIKEFEIVANHLIDSLNGDNCIIKKGYRKSNISSMILYLVSEFLNKPITLHKLLRAKLETPYKEVVENIYTEDLNEVLKLIYKLCETHIKIAQENLEVHRTSLYAEDDEREEAFYTYKELFTVGLYQLPFEVLVWLKLRELKGIKNPDIKSMPKEQIHPLLKTKLSEFYLSLDKLELNNELVYVNKLIDKLVKDYPKIKKYDL